jgi:transposase
MDITDEWWELVRPSIPEPERLHPGPRGGRPYRDPRDVLNAVLWVLRTGASWADLPAEAGDPAGRRNNPDSESDARSYGNRLPCSGRI